MPELANHKPLAHLDEEALLRAIRARKREAPAELYDRFSDIVYSVSLRILREPSAAEGVLQEVFIHLWRSSDSYLWDPGSLGAWLVLSARNHSIDQPRGLHPQDHSEDILPTCKVNFSDLAIRESLTRKVRQAMTEMTPEQRRTLELAFFEGQTPAEIAQNTGGGICVIKDQLRSALLLLRHARQDEHVSTVGNVRLDRLGREGVETRKTAAGQGSQTSAHLKVRHNDGVDW